MPAAAQAESFPAKTVKQSRASVVDYWTEERMAAARPGSELLAGVPAPNSLLDGFVGGGTPSRRSSAQAIADPSKSPYRTHGKVFLTLDGIDYVCSGTVVPAKHKRLVVSAGHCVYGFGRFATNWMFVPAKDGGREGAEPCGGRRLGEPYGCWTAVRLATTPQWAESEDLRYDVGMAKMARRSGRRLQKVVGARGIAFNQGRDLRFEAFGYPAEGPSRFDGKTMFRCTSRAQGTDGGPPPAPTRIDCDMTGGSSGGGWVLDTGQVNSVISYGYECVVVDLVCQALGGNPEEGKLFGPYFGGTIRDLYRSERRKRRR